MSRSSGSVGNLRCKFSPRGDYVFAFRWAYEETRSYISLNDVTHYSLTGPLSGHTRADDQDAMTSANPVKNYKRSWALVNDASGPSRADFASAHTNLPFFVNYIWFIILRVNYNYVGKLQLVIIDCDQAWSIVWIAIDCLNCDRFPELRSIAWIAIDYMSCDRLYELRSIVWVATLSNHFANWKRLYSIS